LLVVEVVDLTLVLDGDQVVVPVVHMLVVEME
jgi:hypothetical protein